MNRVDFNRPTATGSEAEHIAEAIAKQKLSGDGPYAQRCQDWFKSKIECENALLTPSCTAALEMAAILIDIREGDEVIMPSYTFVSTANAFVLRGGVPVFVDISPGSMNIDASQIEGAITSKTKAIVPVHYAGMTCDMNAVMRIAEEYGLYVIEDAAQGMMAKFMDRPLGSIGHLGAYSFHETKNYTSGGEGGLLIINDPELSERAEVIREKGTNRRQFFRGLVDKYQWMDLGSSFLPSELQAAYLWPQLLASGAINDHRLGLWDRYRRAFVGLSETGLISLAQIPSYSSHNAHMFFIKLKDASQRQSMIQHLNNDSIDSVFHYVPLHSSKGGKKYGRFHGADRFTTKESERLLRLPIWYGMREVDQDRVIQSVKSFFR